MLKHTALIAGSVLLFGTAYAATLTKSPLPSVPAKTAAITPVPRQDKWWMPRHEQCVETARKGGFDVMFIGDSITQGWEGGGKAVWEKEIAPLKAANFGFSGDQTQHVLWRLDNGELPATLTPKVAVIMIGTNNTGHKPMQKPEEIAAGVQAVVDRLYAHSSKTKILLMAIFPRGAKPADANRMNNAAANALIAKLAGYKNVKYLDINKKFLQPDGTLTKEIMPDFLHPQAKGYQIWADSVVPEIKKLLAAK